MKKKVFIFDLEGTLSFSNWRESWIPDYESFEALFRYDPCNEWIAEIARRAWDDGHPVVILTGKMVRGRQDVTDWLKKHNIGYTWLNMRSNDDKRPSEIYKMDYIKRFHTSEVAMIFDDRKKIIDYVSAFGYKTYHVKGGQND